MPPPPRTIGEVLDAAGLKPSPRRDLVEQLFLDEGCPREMAGLLPGLLQLEEEWFRGRGFSEQAAFWEALQSALEGGPEGAPRVVLRLLRSVFPAAGDEGPANREGVPAAFVSLVLAHVRRNPFPRLRLAAVQVLMRLGSPGELGTIPGDYLIGLHSPNAVSACGVFNFILNGFGPAALLEVVAFLGRAEKSLPRVLWHLAEASCEEHFRALDHKRLLFHLAGRCGGPAKNIGPAGTAGAGNCPRPEEGLQARGRSRFAAGRGAPAPVGMQEPSAAAPSLPPGSASVGGQEACGRSRARFSRIRSSRPSESPSPDGSGGAGQANPQRQRKRSGYRTRGNRDGASGLLHEPGEGRGFGDRKEGSSANRCRRGPADSGEGESRVSRDACPDQNPRPGGTPANPEFPGDAVRRAVRGLLRGPPVPL